MDENQYEQMDDEPVIHSYFEYMKILIKDRWVLEKYMKEKELNKALLII